MKKLIRVLIVEDSENDKELILIELRRHGYIPVYENVQTADSFKQTLENNHWDIILCDYSMPNFDGISALSIRNSNWGKIPFILLSDTISKDTVTKAINMGANHHLQKKNMRMLQSLIENLLSETGTKQ